MNYLRVHHKNPRSRASFNTINPDPSRLPNIFLDDDKPNFVSIYYFIKTYIYVHFIIRKSTFAFCKVDKSYTRT